MAFYLYDASFQQIDAHMNCGISKSFMPFYRYDATVQQIDFGIPYTYTDALSYFSGGTGVSGTRSIVHREMG